MESRKKRQTGTFNIRIVCCENATWQGELTWLEENRKEKFRSALEMIRLIDGALDTGQDNAT